MLQLQYNMGNVSYDDTSVYSTKYIAVDTSY